MNAYILSIRITKRLLRYDLMLKVFEQLKQNDEKAVKEYDLPSALLMEIAAKGVAEKLIELSYGKEPFYQNLLDGISSFIPNKKTILLVCGSSDNGGDGLALSRIIQDYFNVITVLPYPPKSEMCVIQEKRLKLLGIEVKNKLDESSMERCDILLDAMFGTGFRGEMKAEYLSLLQNMNETKALKIALDVPSGLDILGVPAVNCFKADFTICIGALRAQLYSSLAKDYVGCIILKRLPLPIAKYEEDSSLFLLEENDMKLPFRNVQNVNKGTFGHVAVLQGEKKGAAQLVATAALKFGAGLVTLVGDCVHNSSPDIMESFDIPQNTTCIAIGSGLGKDNLVAFNKFLTHITEHSEISFVLDADIFYYDEIVLILKQKRRMVCTPHPKEFQSLLKIALGVELPIEEIRVRKLELMRTFCKQYPYVVLLLKDCNTFIGSDKNIFINSKGSPSLAKAGTGDVLAGFVVALLSQGYDALSSCITASMAHALASSTASSSYSLTASELIEKIAHSTLI